MTNLRSPIHTLIVHVVIEWPKGYTSLVQPAKIKSVSSNPTFLNKYIVTKKMVKQRI